MDRTAMEQTKQKIKVSDHYLFDCPLTDSHHIAKPEFENYSQWAQKAATSAISTPAIDWFQTKDPAVQSRTRLLVVALLFSVGVYQNTKTLLRAVRPVARLRRTSVGLNECTLSEVCIKTLLRAVRPVARLRRTSVGLSSVPDSRSGKTCLGELRSTQYLGDPPERVPF
ncbi:hypothetical protein CEXT_702841 [Caerostris extrusa]|uniref:Uncharacterized protein n=1 Tax=Caerostris extrusa TaxID=172846 RepID=A0AAV4N6K7_CAEEX|nr:hypothetical protein CEXT_702841 [Caerostris extrusa]